MPEDDLARAYSAALDEIFELRRALAYEAEGLSATLEYKSFPKSRRTVTEAQTERMREAARGGVQHAYGGVYSAALDSALSRAGAPGTLTRHQFEAQKHIGESRRGERGI